MILRKEALLRDFQLDAPEYSRCIFSVESSTDAFDAIAPLEMDAFPESAFELPVSRHVSRYLVVASNEEGCTSIRHLMRTAAYSQGEGMSGSYFIDDICDSGQGVDVRAVLNFYSELGIDLSGTVSVECNLSIGIQRIDRSTRVPWSLYGYGAVFRSALDVAAVFAWTNGAALRSLAKVGWTATTFMGRTDIHAPIRDGSGVAIDPHWRASVLYARDNLDVMAEIERTTSAPFVTVAGTGSVMRQ